MSKVDLTIMISKKRSENGRYFFCIGTSLELGFYQIDLPADGMLPGMGSREHEILGKNIDNTLRIIFSIAKGYFKTAEQKTNVVHKCIFSDKYISTGMTCLGGEKIETYNEMTLPMNHSECDLFFFRIPLSL